MNSKIPKKLSKVFGENEIFLNHPDAIKGLEEAPEMGFKEAMREGNFMGMSVEDQKSMFKERAKMMMQMGRVMTRMMKEQKKVSKSLKNNPDIPLEKADKNLIAELEKYALSMNVELGYTRLKEEYIFKNEAVLYKNIIVLSMEMDKEKIDLAPSLETQKMIMKTYHELGVAANKLTNFLRKRGFAAHAGHPLGGSVSYPPLAQDAGMGLHGRHGLIITPSFGPRHRLAAVFTSIENLPKSKDNNYDWIKDYCKSCGRCIEKCPAKAIYEEPITNANSRVTHIDSAKCFPYFGKSYGCSICIKECMFHRVGYEKLKRIFDKKKRE